MDRDPGNPGLELADSGHRGKGVAEPREGGSVDLPPLEEQ